MTDCQFATNSRYISRFPTAPVTTSRIMSMVSALRTLWRPENLFT